MRVCKNKNLKFFAAVCILGPFIVYFGWSRVSNSSPHSPEQEQEHRVDHGDKQEPFDHVVEIPNQLNVDSQHVYHRKIEGLDKKVTHTQPYKPISDLSFKKQKESTSSDVVPILCDINHGDASVRCLKKGSEVYIPYFSFLSKYYELYGEIQTISSDEEESAGKNDKFFWRHSYSKFFTPRPGKYTYKSPFMSFDHYNVESRERVKLITADEGIPISTQWSPLGYPYPIQISQYGLSHHSKHLLANMKKSKDGDIHYIGREHGDWNVPVDCKFEAVSSAVSEDDEEETIGSDFPHTTPTSRQPFEFSVPDSAPKGIRLPLNAESSKLTTLLMEIQPPPGSNFSLTIQVRTRPLGLIRLHYCVGCTAKKGFIRLSPDKKDIYYSMGAGQKKGWKCLSRNLVIDIRKAVTPGGSNRKERRKMQKQAKAREEAGLPPGGTKVAIRRLQWISLRGSGRIRSLGLAKTGHVWQFLAAADWLVKHQDFKSGGWPVPVKRKLGEAGVTLEPGWLSGMAQGQAISLLVRAEAFTGDKTYLKAALKAVKPLKFSVTKGGVCTYFLDKTDLPWYEEYPTQPSLFVLNGFIYSLLGLRDLNERAQLKDVEKSSVEEIDRLLNRGLKTLSTLLPLFDAGSGSFYDLRHLTMKVPPRLARWDYHATHVTQLMLLAKLYPKNKLFASTAKRWATYFKGKRVKHN